MSSMRKLPIASLGLLGILLSVVSYERALSWERQVRTLEFQARAQDDLAIVRAAMQEATALLGRLRAYFESRELPVSREEFARFATVLDSGMRGLRATGWAPRVPAAARDGFVAAVRQSGLPDFDIMERAPDGRLIRAGQRAAYYPILYTDAGLADAPPFGLDLASEPVPHAAIRRAETFGVPAATPQTTLPATTATATTAPRSGVVSVLAVAGPVAGPAGTGSANHASAGVVFGAFAVGPLVESIIDARHHLTPLDIYVFDPKRMLGEGTLFWRGDGPVPPEPELRARPHLEGRIALADQSWGVLLMPSGGLSVSPWAPHVLMPPAIGLLLTALVLGVLGAGLRRTRELERTSAHIAHLAGHDPLSGLPNRRVFYDRLNEAMALAGLRPGGAVLQIDLDRFKPVNDAHGHAVGDGVLRVVADRLRALVRRGDTVARLGGDEFAIILPGASVDQAIRLGRRAVASLSQPIAVGATAGGVVVEIGASVGIAAFPQDGRAPDQVLRAADLAMYQAKRLGRGGCQVFQAGATEEGDLAGASASAEHIGAKLVATISSGAIEPFFQPLVRLSDGALLGFEILARWRHPTRGIVPPDAFIPAIEEHGLMANMTASLLRRACIAASDWPPHIGLAVNVSPSQLTDRALPEQLLAILAETGFRPERLEVEVTESALVRDEATARLILERLRRAGVRVALDDFGTGHSTLSHLQTLPFDSIKIDRSFVRAMVEGDEDSRIVRAILALTRTLGIVATAEGIETTDVARTLLELGCEHGQGYHYGRPMPAHEAEAAFDLRPQVAAAD